MTISANHYLTIESVNVSETKGTIKTPQQEIVLTEKGICGDAHAHLDMLDLLLMGSPVILFIKYKWYWFKNLIKKK